jgi:DNA polymerase-3 subunit epsilon
MLQVLQNPIPVSGERPVKQPFAQLGEKDWRLYAVGSPLETKDLLKERAYPWDAPGKARHRTLREAAMRETIVWLKENVYKRSKTSLVFESFDAKTRLSR